jgi:hypothetical protein
MRAKILYEKRHINYHESESEYEFGEKQNKSVDSR